MAVPASGGPAARLFEYLPLDPLAPLAEQELDLAVEQQGLGGDPSQDDEKQNQPQDAGSDPDPQGEPEGEDPDIDAGDEPQGDEPDGDDEGWDDEEDEGPGGEGEDEGGEGVDAPLPPFVPGPRPIPGFTHRPETGEYIREFDSWWDFVTSAQRDPSPWTARCASRDNSHGKSWYGTDSFDETLEMALHRGWPEGRALLEESLVSIPPQPRVYETLEFDVAGAFPCVPLYCAGDPSCMVLDPGANLRNAKPIIRIDYNHWIHAGVATKDMMLRGAAIVSLANSLEEQGFSTELRIIGNSKASGGWRGGKDQIFRYSIVFKKAGENLDLDRAAFAIAHPSSMRRLAFAILEQHAELEANFHVGYGAPMYEPNDPTSGQIGGAIFVPGSRGGETPDSARKAVSDAAQALLTQMFEEAAD